MKINFEDFKDIFNKCMKSNQTYITNLDETGKVFGDWASIEPACCIRDFETATEDNPDVEFKNLQDAWNYVNSITYCRIMSASGTIWFDNMYGDEE